MATLSLQQGVDDYAGCKFAGMRATNNTTKTYHDEVQWAGRLGSTAVYRAMLAFDLTDDVLIGCTVTAATLKLWFTAESNTTDRAVYLYQMLKAWNEPAATAEPASDVADDPCWNYQYYNETAWQTAGASGAEDRDTSVVSSATVTGAAADPNEVEITFDFDAGMIALVQGWIDETIANYGVQVVGVEDTDSATKQWATATYATTTKRPLLTITYTAGGGVASYTDDPAVSGAASATVAELLAAVDTSVVSASAATSVADVLAGFDTSAVSAAAASSVVDVLAGIDSVACSGVGSVVIAEEFDATDSASCSAAASVTITEGGAATTDDLEVSATASASVAEVFAGVDALTCTAAATATVADVVAQTSLLSCIASAVAAPTEFFAATDTASCSAAATCTVTEDVGALEVAVCWTLRREGRMHYTLPEGRCHYTLRAGRMDYTIAD